ncbi:MAG: plastocyanin [bacterium]|nr:plastocyanin [bacterium]
MRAYAMIAICSLVAMSGCGDDTSMAGPTSVPPADLATPAVADLSAVAGADMTAGDMATAGAITEVTTTNGLMFVPASVTIARGGTVRWRNVGSVTHTVTSGASSAASSNPGILFDQNPLAPGATFDFTFNTAGTQPYFCRFHEAMGMKGAVTVTP